MTRTFEDKLAVRSAVPLWVGEYGPSGSGKTFTAGRLAVGMQRVTGGDIFWIDTESRRALHYADQFKFRHLEFKAPFSPLDYLGAVEHCYNKGGRIIIIDSMSHEHDGPGGVLEMHETELNRLSEGKSAPREAFNMLAWAKPKAERRRFINTLLQMNANFIFCFRAKEKVKMPKKGDRDREVKPLGFMPIAGEEYIYEMTINFLLHPNSGGIPSWHPEEMGEKQMIKLPIQFKKLFEAPRPLDESHGEALAQWAAGSVSLSSNKITEQAQPAAPSPVAGGHPLPPVTTSQPDPFEHCREMIPKAETMAELQAIWKFFNKVKDKMTDEQRAALNHLKEEQKKTIEYKMEVPI